MLRHAPHRLSVEDLHNPLYMIIGKYIIIGLFFKEILATGVNELSFHVVLRVWIAPEY